MIRSYKFWIGFTIIVGLIASSILFSVLFDSHIRQVQILYDKNMQIIDTAPFPPSLKFPMGTDGRGYDTFLKILQGAKFTLISVIVIGFLRVITSLAVAIPLAFYLPEQIRKKIDQLLNTFYYVPLTIIAIFILTPILQEQIKLPEGEEYFFYSFIERVSLEAIILTILVVPLLSSMLSNMVVSILKEDFIEGSIVLGASRWRIFHKHVLPHLFPKLLIVWCQQCAQVLIIFAHLGYFKLFFGGTDIDFNPMMADPPSSMSNEWSGLIGDYYSLIFARPVTAIAPIVMFAVAIFAFQLMADGFSYHLQTKHRKKIKKVKEKTMITAVKPKAIKRLGKFQFLQNKGA